jgi:lipopolysaccharide/colanic/teichoic acid biosynthesis glycosyltransferase
MKRPFDILGALCGLIFIAPLTPFIALAIILEGEGPVFVRLPRVSRGNIVHIYKFRTMVPNAHAMRRQLAHKNERTDGPFFKMKRDPRLTSVGRFLRKFRLDEFPQFWNVLRGEISLVGPRPHEPEEMLAYPPEYKKLYLAQAGLTGLSQVSGASKLSFLEELHHDLYYHEHRSTWLDVKILGKTVWIFLSDPTGV